MEAAGLIESRYQPSRLYDATTESPSNAIEQSRSSEASSSLPSQDIDFLEPTCSLPPSQGATTGAYSEPDQSDVRPHSVLEDPFKYYLPIKTRLLQVVSSLLISSPKPCMRHSFPYVPHTPPHPHPQSHSCAFRQSNNIQ
jgi:hypothetical protein